MKNLTTSTQNLKKNKNKYRGAGTRTPDLLLPKQSVLGSSHRVTHTICLTESSGFSACNLARALSSLWSTFKTDERLLNYPTGQEQGFRGMWRSRNSLKQGSFVVVPKTPRSRESYAWHKQTINGVSHRKLNRLPRHTTRTTTCFQTVRSHLTGLLRLLDCL